MDTETKIYVNNDLDIVMTRMQVRDMAKKMGFGTADQARISLAASELARVLSWGAMDPTRWLSLIPPEMDIRASRLFALFNGNIFQKARQLMGWIQNRYPNAVLLGLVS